MKKSQMYQWAQCAVLESPNMTTMTKLDILRVLFGDEDIELYREKQEAEKKAQEEKANEAV